MLADSCAFARVYSDNLHYRNREISRYKLLSLLQSNPFERDRFVSHRYQSRRTYRRTCEIAGKSGKRIERCVISSFQIAESMGFKGEFRHWEDLLRVGE